MQLNELISLLEAQQFKFDKDIVNTETFDASNGEFTAGKDSLYYFSLGFLLFSPIQWTQLVFMKNGRPTDSVFQYKTGKEASQQIHASTMLALVKDDKITIDISSISTIKYLQCSKLKLAYTTYNCLLNATAVQDLSIFM